MAQARRRIRPAPNRIGRALRTWPEDPATVRKIIASMRDAPQRRAAAGSSAPCGLALIERQRLRRGQFAQLEFAVRVEQPVFHQIDPAHPIEQLGRRWG